MALTQGATPLLHLDWQPESAEYTCHDEDFTFTAAEVCYLHSPLNNHLHMNPRKSMEGYMYYPLHAQLQVIPLLFGIPCLLEWKAAYVGFRASEQITDGVVRNYFETQS